MAVVAVMRDGSARRIDARADTTYTAAGFIGVGAYGSSIFGTGDNFGGGTIQTLTPLSVSPQLGA